MGSIWLIWLIALVWGLIVPILGLMQVHILPTSAHGVIPVLHLLVGITAIALANIRVWQILWSGVTHQPGVLSAR